MLHGAPSVRRRQLIVWGVVAGLLVLALFARPLAPLWVLAVGAVLTGIAARQERFLFRVALAAYGVRALLAIGFYVLTALDIGLLAPLLTAPVEGHRFWIFALDSPSTHQNGVMAMRAWREGFDFPIGTGPEYYIFTGIVYLVLGPHPLNVVLMNGLFGSLAVVIGHRIAGRLVGGTAAKISALAIAFWPSSLIWSTQLLKESICIWLTLLILSLTMILVETLPFGVAKLPRWLGRLVLIFVAAVVMYLFRANVYFLLVPVPAVFILHALFLSSGRARWRQCLSASLLLALMIGGYDLGRRIDLNAIFSPRQPEAEFINRGVVLQAARKLDEAEAEYRKALELRPASTRALLNIASVMLAKGDSKQTIEFLAKYVERQPYDNAAREALERVRSGVPPGPLLPATAPLKRWVLQLTGPASPYEAGIRMIPFHDFVRAIAVARWNYTGTGGYSMIDPHIQFKSLTDILIYLPRGIANLFLVPYPWQWFDTRGGTGIFKGLAALEAILLYALTLPLLIGAWLVYRTRSADGLYILAFVALTGVSFALVITNLGTFFRLRLEFLLPFFTVLGPGIIVLGRRFRPGERLRAAKPGRAARSREHQAAVTSSTARAPL